MSITYKVTVQTFDRKPELTQEIWELDGKIQRENNLPAIEFRNDQQDIVMKWWFTDGEHYRVGGPNIIFDDGSYYEECWSPHNPHGPSAITKRNGVLIHERWKNEHGIHREGAPASITIDRKTNIVTQELWFRNGKRHRDDGPAIILRDKDTGEVYTKLFYKNGRQQRALSMGNATPSPT